MGRGGGVEGKAHSRDVGEGNVDIPQAAASQDRFCLLQILHEAYIY